MYIVDLFKRLGKKENIPTVIYLVLNVLLTAAILYMFYYAAADINASFWPCLGIGFVVYLISVMIALSPIGEFIIRLQTGCKKIKDPEIANFLEPLFREVYMKAKAANPNISDNVRLFISYDEEPNAFATGRKTVCVTQGMLYQDPEDIKAVLAHEFGHIAHKDTDLIMLISAGNFIVTTLILIIRIICGFFNLILWLTGVVTGSNGMYRIGSWIVMVVVGLFMKLWSMIGVALVMKSSRGHEFLADEFACRLGYRDRLIAFLDAIDGSSKPKGLFAALSASHPCKADRFAYMYSLDLDSPAGLGYDNAYAGYGAPESYGAPVEQQYQYSQYEQPTTQYQQPTTQYQQPTMAAGYAAQPQNSALSASTFCPMCGTQSLGGAYCSGCGYKF